MLIFFYCQLQSTSIDAVTAAEYLGTFTPNIQRIRDACDTMNMGELAINIRHTDVCNEKRREARKVYDVILVQGQKRFCFSGHLEANRLLDSSNFGQFSRQFPHTVINNNTSLYLSLDKHKLTSELQVLYYRVELHSFKSLTELLQSFLDVNLIDTFCEVLKLGKILTTTPMTTAES